MIIYSSLVILTYLVFLFCQLPYIMNKPGTKYMFDHFSKNYQVMIGLKVFDDNQLDNNLLKIFVPYLIFLCASVYIKSETEKWHYDDERFKQDILTKIEQPKVIPYKSIAKQEQRTSENLISETLKFTTRELGSLHCSLLIRTKVCGHCSTFSRTTATFC
jgi:hypothetical protein